MASTDLVRSDRLVTGLSVTRWHLLRIDRRQSFHAECIPTIQLSRVDRHYAPAIFWRIPEGHISAEGCLAPNINSIHSIILFVYDGSDHLWSIDVVASAVRFKYCSPHHTSLIILYAQQAIEIGV